MRRAHPRLLVAGLAVLALTVPLVGLAPPTAAPADDARSASGSGGVTLSLSSGLTIVGLPVSARVAVTAAGATPAGRVRVLVDGTAVAVGRLTADGTVRIPLLATVAVGRHTVTADYAGAADAGPTVATASVDRRTLTVTRTLPAVRTDGTDWSVGRVDRKEIHVQVLGVAGLAPTGTVVVRVDGVPRATARLGPSGAVVLRLAIATRTALVVVTYSGDRTYLPWFASPRLLVVR